MTTLSLRELACGLLLSALLSGSGVQAESTLMMRLQDERTPNAETHYALIRRNDTMLFSGDSSDVSVARQHRKQQPADYLWVKREQQQYVIDDPAVLSEVQQLWQPLTPHEQEMDTLSAQMEQHGEQMELLGEQMETLVDEYGVLDPEGLQEVTAQQEALHALIEPISERMSAVGDQIEAASEEAHQKTLALIEAAIKSGKAKPLTAAKS